MQCLLSRTFHLSVQSTKCTAIEKRLLFSICSRPLQLIKLLQESRRLKVAFTRANSVFWIVGNIAALRTQLAVIVKQMKCKKLGIDTDPLLGSGQLHQCEGMQYSSTDRKREKGMYNEPLALTQPLTS